MFPVNREPGATVAAQRAVDAEVERVRGAERASDRDLLAVEEPLEIRLHVETDRRLVHRTVSVTMPTPGDDAELAVGFLYAEGIVCSAAQIADVHPCGEVDGASGSRSAVRVCLVPGTAVLALAHRC